MTKSSSFVLQILFVFAFGFSFIFACYGGLPIDFHADYLNDSLRSLETTNPAELIQRTLNPLTPGWFYPPSGMMEYMRPLQVLSFHLSHRFSPFTAIPFQAAAAVAFGILEAVVFALIVWWMGRRSWGWLAAIFLASFPSNFFIMATIASFDLQHVVSLLTLAALLLFYALTRNRFRSRAAFLLGLFGWFVILWVTIKLKSSEKLIPFVCLAFLIFRLRFIAAKIGRLRCGMLALGFAAALILVVPFKPFEAWLDEKPLSAAGIQNITWKPRTDKDKKAFSFNLQNGIRRTFYAPGEAFPFFTPIPRSFPRSLSGNLGFLPAWLFWISLGAFLVSAGRKRVFAKSLGGAEFLGENRQHFFWLIVTWFAAILAGFSSGVSVEDVRFLNFAYVPCVLLLFMLGAIFEGPEKSRAVRWILGVAVGVTSLWNFLLLAQLIGFFGGFQDALVRAEKDVFQAARGRPPAGAEIYKGHTALEAETMVIDWYELAGDWFEKAEEKLRRGQTLYFYSRHPEPGRLDRFRKAGCTPHLWKQYDFLDAQPAAFRVCRGLLRLLRAAGINPETPRIVVYQIPPA